MEKLKWVWHHIDRRSSLFTWHIQYDCFQTYIWSFCHSQGITDFLNPWHLFPCFPKPLFRLIGMVSDACLSRNTYFPWTSDYTQFIFGPYLFIWTFLFFLCVYPFYDFPKYNFGMMTYDSYRSWQYTHENNKHDNYYMHLNLNVSWSYK